MRRILRDPLVHFLIGGALFWMLFAWRGEDADPASRRIVVGEERRAGLAEGFAQIMGRAPTARELAGLVETDIREEVLYREALRLGLDRDDPVIRRRLAKKMGDLAAAEAEAVQPTDAELRRWLAAYPERFATGAAVSFEQRSFATERAAQKGLARLRGGGAVSGEARDVPTTVTNMPLREVRELFGAQFSEALSGLEAGGGWAGPVPSGLGWHALRLTARDTGTVPPLEAIRDAVSDDWRGSTMQARREAAFAILRAQYRVTVEP